MRSFVGHVEEVFELEGDVVARAIEVGLSDVFGALVRRELLLTP